MRFKVYYGKDEQDFIILYTEDKQDPVEQRNNLILEFKKYHPDKSWTVIEEYPDKTANLVQVLRDSGEADEHEFLMSIIMAAKDLKVEARIANLLVARGWGKE